jgi:hypothetical protein
VLSDLSVRLAQRYGNGFSVPSLQNFRKFYLAYSDRVAMGHEIQYPAGTKSSDQSISSPLVRKSFEMGDELQQGFSSQLSWSHYRALMRVENEEARNFYEWVSDLECCIITHLQRFLLELGNGFAFVSRQKHIRIGDDDCFIDLVFYHCRLKFYLLTDLKVGELTHADVGQMDGYVRMYDGLFVEPDDNPTIG